MISIIIPHHYEDKEKIKPLMTSINSQIGIDFDKIEILLCSDVDLSPLDALDFTEYENICNRIRKIKSPFKNNIGLSRQAGIDEARGDYIVFCDADDSLYHMGALRELQDNINYSHADMYRFKFLEEIGGQNTKDRLYKTKEFNWIWVFGKAYKTDFIRRNNIRFSSKLRYHEDSYFNFILRYKKPNVVDVDSFPMYLWRYSDTSITRANNHEYSFVTWDEFLDAISLGIRKVTGEYGDNCNTDILTCITKSYILLNNPLYKRFDGEKREKIELAYFNFIKEFAPGIISNGVSEDVENVITKIFFQSSPNFIPDVSWDAYTKYIIEKYNK